MAPARLFLAVVALLGVAASPVDQAARSRADHWAFKPVVHPAVPAVKHRAWARNPMDDFVLAKLDAAKLDPSPEADRVTLILPGEPEHQE